MGSIIDYIYFIIISVVVDPPATTALSRTF